ncbi:DUF6978 family protein [Anabaena sp. WFMT]|uniref:DUF6978 family protein n=1 Tax=Anabaena sp. WFMT TaxID=3449730 RepID=UPI003F240B04
MLSQDEFENLIVDSSKCIQGDIIWDKNKRNPPAYEFRVNIISDASYPLIVKGWYNYFANQLSYSIIHCDFEGQRIYGLDLGKDHQNPDGVKVGRKHKHRWLNQYFKDKLNRDKFIGDTKAYVPDDITALANDPIGVWHQFCLESKIIHHGTMQQPIIPKLDL